MKISRKKKIWFAICAALLLCGLACGVSVRLLSNRLLTQREAERWQGENEQSFVQLSCFLPDQSAVGLNEVYAFRYAMLDSFRDAGIEWSDAAYPFIDAWSREDQVTISGDKRSTEAPVLAVGGQFFAFHPLRLLSGSYLSEDDLSPDRVVLDRELAWELFGGIDLGGMTVQINGVEFTVGGVVDRESDSASRRAYTGEKGFFMSYDAFRAITEQSSIDCYEVVVPEAVKGYGAQLVNDKFPISGGEVVVNTGRFAYDRMLRIAKDLPSRAAHAGSVRYPYWENAARITENECAALTALETALILPAAITLLVELIRLLARGKTALEDDLIPKAREGVEEAVRVQARKRWEKKHPQG
ncbi:MAG: ABC transporter permease [Oscillospiraceae bacterium]|nr:ABC transporter permease [Oscillospiraceae bacterium]